jgi:integrase
VVRDGKHEAKPFCVRHRDRPREFYASAELAVARKRELVALEKRHGSAALDYDRAVHAQVVEARALLPEGVSVVDAARFWADHHPAGTSPEVALAVEQFIEAKVAAAGDVTSRHVRDLRSRMRGFVLAFGERSVAAVNSEAVLAWLQSLEDSPRTVANYRSAVQNFFNFAVRRGWLGRSPMERIATGDLPRVPASTKHPLTVAQANALLAVVQAERPAYLAHFALRLFLGFRTSEARRFRWEWIQPELGRVYIPAHGTKTGDAWSIDDVPPRFWELVRKPWRNGQVPAPYVRAWEGSKAIPGERTAQPGLKAQILSEIGRVNWPDNATRDTFCTLHISAYRDPQRTALVLKHRNSQTLWQSYLGALMPEAQARGFFEG